MGKAFIEIKLKNKKCRLNANDITKVFKMNKFRTPPITCYDLKTIVLSETDDDMD